MNLLAVVQLSHPDALSPNVVTGVDIIDMNNSGTYGDYEELRQAAEEGGVQVRLFHIADLSSLDQVLRELRTASATKLGCGYK